MEFPRDLPDELHHVPATIHDFTTGELLASGNASIRFVPHTDKLRVRRQLFEGEFQPENAAEAQALRQRLILGLSQGAPAMNMYIQYKDEVWAFVVKLQMGEAIFPFTGRAEPTRV